ncbi:hypothetical protein PIB30_093046 [Stylosanthes scabra]|uniref:Uncharacterized protein n=1 Tax=Stylosanthes scabra TaxID=79078 RepID=A0ABU6ZTP9_9FABA|nr:hypothetical protein [Stylosanthes scabra]
MGSGFGTKQRKAYEDRDFGLRRQEFCIETLHRKKEYGIRIPADLVSAQEEREGMKRTRASVLV